MVMPGSITGTFGLQGNYITTCDKKYPYIDSVTRHICPHAAPAAIAVVKFHDGHKAIGELFGVWC